MKNQMALLEFIVQVSAVLILPQCPTLLSFTSSYSSCMSNSAQGSYSSRMSTIP